MASGASKGAKKVKIFNKAGFQVAIHCIGDKANRIALDIFEDLKPQFHDIDEIQDGVQNYYDEKLCNP